MVTLAHLYLGAVLFENYFLLLHARHLMCGSSFSFAFRSFRIQSDPEGEGKPDVQREPGHRLRPDADEGPGARRHDGAQRHPIPEARGGDSHYERGHAVLRGGKSKMILPPVTHGFARK